MLISLTSTDLFECALEWFFKMSKINSHSDRSHAIAWGDMGREKRKKQLREWVVSPIVVSWIRVMLTPYNSRYCLFRCALFPYIASLKTVQYRFLLIFCFRQTDVLWVVNVTRMLYFASHIIKWMRDITCLSRYMINLANTTEMPNAIVDDMMSQALSSCSSYS